MRGLRVEPAGFAYTEDFLDEATEEALLAFLASLDLQPMTIRGNASKRTVGHFGLRYDYGSHVLRKAEPIPGELEPQIRRAEALAGLKNGAIDEALVNPLPAGRKRWLAQRCRRLQDHHWHFALSCLHDPVQD
jgi:hypothetical protein